MVKLLIAVLLCSLLPFAATAQDNWRFSGFASLAAGRLEDSELSYSGYDSEKWRFDGDSVIGLQLGGDLMERLSLTLQVVSRAHSFDNSDQYEPVLDWLFLSYQLNPNWRLRAGRMRTPFYLYSETLDVGYSYVWVRPPIDVYSKVLAPFSNFDGADITYLLDVNDTSVDLQFLAGRVERTRDELELQVDVKPMLGGNIKVQNGPYTFRYSLFYNQSDIRLKGERPVDPVYRQLIESNDDYRFVIDSLRSQDAWYRYQSLALRWEQGDYTILSEGFDIKNTDTGYSNDADGWYVSLQKRCGNFTPYIVRGAFTNELNKEALHILRDSYTSFVPGQPGYEVFDQVRDSIWYYYHISNTTQKTWTIGLRWDFHTNLALKAEWERLDFSTGTAGQFLQQDLTPASHTSLGTLSLDWVF